MSNYSTDNPEPVNPQTPKSIIPDLYVGISPSFSSHFLNNNIAIPPSSNNIISPSSLQYQLGSVLSPHLMHPPSLINIHTPYTDKKPKTKRQLSAKEFNDMFSGQLESPTRFRHSTSIIKRKLNYFGTFEFFDKPAVSSSSMPATPVRYSYELSSDMDMHDMNLTPMRYQYRLSQIRNHRAILLRSPLRNKERPKVSRSLLRSFDEMTRSTYPTADENLGDYSIASIQSAANSRIRVENSNESSLSTESSSTTFEFVGSQGGLNRHHPEVLLDCAGTMISMKEVSVDTLYTIKQRMNLKNKEMNNSSHFTL